MGSAHDILGSPKVLSTAHSTHSLSPRLQPAPQPSCCCPWQSFHSTGGSCCHWATLSPVASTSLHDPFSSGPSTATKATPMASSDSQSAEYQRLSMTTPLCPQNHLESNTHNQYKLPTQGTTMATSGTQTTCIGPEELLLKRSYSMILFSLSPLISHPQLSSINFPSNTKVLLQGYWSLVNHS